MYEKKGRNLANLKKKNPSFFSIEIRWKNTFLSPAGGKIEVAGGQAA